MSVVPKIRWADLQTFASGERAQKGDKVSLAYSWQGHAVRLDLTYGDLIYDAPMNNKRLNTDRYKYIDIATYLRQ